MIKPVATIGLLALAAVGLAACGATTTGTAANPALAAATNHTSAAAGTTLPSGGVAPTGVPVSSDFNQSGLVLSLCTYDTSGPLLELMLLDPNNGRTLAIQSVSVSGRVTLCDQPNLGPQGLRSQFDQGYDRMVVTLKTTGEGGNPGSHVGFVDMRSGQFTDLTARRQPLGGFSTMSAQDDNPAFLPGSETIWYYSALGQGHVYSADVNSGVSTEQSPTNVPTELCWLAAYTCGRLPGVHVPFDAVSGIVNPSGTAAEANADRLYIAPGWHAVDKVSSCDATACPAGLGWVVCSPRQWLDDYRLLCDRFVVVRFTTDYEAASGTVILPPNDRNNMTPVASPDRSSVAFVSLTETKYSIYRTGLTGGVEPRLVGPLPMADYRTAATLIEWK